MSLPNSGVKVECPFALVMLRERNGAEELFDLSFL